MDEQIFREKTNKMIVKQEHVRIIQITGTDVKRWLEQQEKAACLQLVKRENSLVSWELIGITELYKYSFHNSTSTFNLPALILWRHHLFWGELLFETFPFLQMSSLQLCSNAVFRSCLLMTKTLSGDKVRHVFFSNFEHGNHLYSVRADAPSSPSNSTPN